MGTVCRLLLSRVGLAVLPVSLAVPLTRLVPPLEQHPYAVFFAAVVVSTWLGGSRASLLATALSGVALDFFFLPPVYTLGPGPADGVRLLAFVLAGALLGLFQVSRERAEASLRQRERRRGEFLAVMAHELRNFLAPVVAAVRILRGTDGDDPAGVRCLEIVERQVHNMGRLINDLLDAARLEQGKLRLNPETVDLTTAVAQVVETARPVVEARRHRLTTDLPAGPLHVQADPTRLAQIVMNLLTNAARYTQPGGQITVVLERVAGEAVLRVRDSGVGIPPEKLEEVFAPFVQVGEGAADGLGVGLSLARGLARLHGGDIRARSDGPGQGSEFVVCLPLPPDEATVIELVRKPPRPA